MQGFTDQQLECIERWATQRFKISLPNSYIRALNNTLPSKFRIDLTQVQSISGVLYYSDSFSTPNEIRLWWEVHYWKAPSSASIPHVIDSALNNWAGFGSDGTETGLGFNSTFEFMQLLFKFAWDTHAHPNAGHSK